MPKDRDPYAPPPRHRDSSGAVLRFAIIAALLGLGVWAYTEFADTEGPSLTAGREQATTLADSSADRTYTTTPTPAAPAAPATDAAPATAPTTEPAPARSAPAAQPSEATPPPSTTIGGSPGR